MALSPQALFKGLTQVLLPSSGNQDSVNNDVSVRMGKYGEVSVVPMVRKQQALAEEGSYFTANNNQSGLAMTTTVAFSATAPFFTIYNGNPAGGKNIYIDYAALVTTAAGSAASGLTTIQSSVVLDSGNRYSSGGTQLTARNVNICQTSSSGATIYAGAVTASAATGYARTIVGLRTLRPTVSATVADVVGETKVLNFGGVEGGSAGTITVGSANIIPVSLPPIVVCPGYSALIYVYFAAAGTPVAASYAPEIGFWER